MTARLLIGDVFERLADIADGSVDCIVTSPPYWFQRVYKPGDPRELGREPNPAAYLGGQLRVADELHRVLSPHGTAWINLGDKAAGSGGAGGDYNPGGPREGQRKFGSVARATGTPLGKSVCWLPDLLGASMAYGRNLLDPEQACQQWVTRPSITWCKPAPNPGECEDKCREATELIIFATKQGQYWFDIDAVRREPIPENERTTWNQNGPKRRAAERAGKPASGKERHTKRTTNPAGSPPLNWWVVNSEKGAGMDEDGGHWAVMPSELCYIPIEAGCPRRVCRTCGTPSSRLVERSNQGPKYTYESGSSRKDAGLSDYSTERRFLGWSTCGCPGADGLRDDGYHAGDGWRPGLVLDPFGGTGTTAKVATGLGRDALLIDFDEANVDRCMERVGPLLLTVEYPERTAS